MSQVAPSRIVGGMSNAVRHEHVFRGQVQGVGFRYTTRHIAQRFAVRGFVRNEPDGSVRLVIEGAADELERFVAAIRAELARHIDDHQHDVHPATGEFADFGVRF